MTWPKFPLPFVFRSLLTGVLFISLCCLCLSTVAGDWRSLSECALVCGTVRCFCSPSPSCSHPRLFFRQGSRIEEMTSAIPFMRTTASWIRKLMSAGRSLLRTLSGTIGRVTPNEAFVESRKLRVHPCEVEISSRSHLEQEPWPDEPSHFYLKHHAQIASFEIDNLLYKSVCFTKAYHFACVSHKGMVSQRT